MPRNGSVAVDYTMLVERGLSVEPLRRFVRPLIAQHGCATVTGEAGGAPSAEAVDRATIPF